MTKINILVPFLFIAITSYSQNPLIRDQFSADPSARVFGDKVYVYPSHDILATQGRGRVGWFCMEDYHVFSSPNLVDWTDHGAIVSQYRVDWVDPTGYCMWAPDCIYRNGKYYFYFPSRPKDTTFGRGFAVGVAMADKPEGPFTPQSNPIKDVHGIDPNVFIDKDGQAYLYWAQGNIYGAKLKEDMLELASEPKILGELPDKGLKEGPYLFERNGIYYLTYPHVQDKTEQLEYAIGNSPLGPFKVTGVIMDERATCWTNHHSILQFKNQWYLFYHYDDLSPDFDKARSIRLDSLFFNADGTIKKVNATLRGVGLTDASKKIQIDRYSAKSEEGVSIAFLDTANKLQGWKTIFDKPGAWVQYNSVDFGKKKWIGAVVRVVRATSAGVLELRLDNTNGPVIARFTIPKRNDLSEIKMPFVSMPTGIHNLFVTLPNNGQVEIDWVSFDLNNKSGN